MVATNNLSQWLQIDFGSLHTKTTRVATQGRNGLENWVTKYKLKFSNDVGNFTYYREPGETDDKVKCTPKLTTLDPPVTATFVTAHQLQLWALTVLVIAICGKRGGLMVSALVHGSSGPGSSPGRGHCVVVFGKTLNSHSASLHPGV